MKLFESPGVVRTNWIGVVPPSKAPLWGKFAHARNRLVGRNPKKKTQKGNT